MRVAFVASSAPARTAVGNLLAEKVAFFHDRGAEVRVFLESVDRLHSGLADDAERLAEIPTAGPAWEFLSLSDLVFFEFSVGFRLLGLLPALAGRRPKLVATYYGISPAAGWPAPQRELIERGCRDRGLLWFADAVAVLSRSSRDELTAATGLPRDRCRTQSIPLDLERWRPGDGGRREPPAILFVGRLAPNKRFHLLIESLPHLPGAEAWIVGDDGDVYAEAARAGRDLAARLGVEARVRWLGDVPDDDLPDVYRRASVLVLPSVHEGFGIPVLEAHAVGLPVVAARAAALPETVADAGLTFRPDDVGDLARQLRRVLESRGAAPIADRQRRVAIVAFRFGSGFVGGAETSLRNLGQALAAAGDDVEVFTTCTVRESDWKNDLPPGETVEAGLRIRRFPIDLHDRPRHDSAFRAILEKNGNVAPEVEAEYLANSIQSAALIAGLKARVDDFDAIIVGPYLHGLTYTVARTFAEKTLLVPCFHDEPSARLRAWLDIYGSVAGILYHTPEERDFAQTMLGLNHPAGSVVGAWLPDVAVREKTAESPRTLVYCGRYSIQKNIPRLIDFARRYLAERPDRFRWIFMGEGAVRPPTEAWCRDLGRVDEDEKHRRIAGADALVQLSTQESLSLVVLEAWRQATPVVVHEDAPVLAGQITRSGGGALVGDYDSFSRALDDLWENPERWRDRGLAGQRYVGAEYLDRDAFAHRVRDAINHARSPLAEQMRRRGIARAATFARDAWRDEFGRFVEAILDAPPRSRRYELTLEPLAAALTPSATQATLLLPVKVVNRGESPTVADGPAASKIDVELRDRSSAEVVGRGSIPLGDIVLPGRSATTLLPIDLPRRVGRFALSLRFGGSSAHVELPVEIGDGGGFDGGVGPLLRAAEDAIALAHARQTLPLDYVDVCEGRFARWKRWLKQKLLNNFKRAYVDAVSAQQTEVNRRLVESVLHLTECCRALDQTVRALQEQIARRGDEPAPPDGSNARPEDATVNSD